MDLFPYLLFLFVFANTRCLFVATLWSSVGEELTLALLNVMMSCVFVTFLFGVLGQVWYLIVSIPDLCRLPLIKDDID